MLSALRQLDRILRGEATRLPSLSSGRVEIPVGGLLLVLLLLGVFYGLCMGCFAVVNDRAGGVLQMLSSMLKVPALFFLTLLVTFPSLYVFNALVGSRLTIASLLRLLVAAMAVMLALLASFGTIVAFFSFTTDSHPFMVLLNVLVFAVCGFLGLSFLLQTLHRLTVVQERLESFPPPPLPAPMGPDSGEPPPTGPDQGEQLRGALEPMGRPPGQNVKTVFRLWIVLFGLVGAQMSWILRPFVGGGEEFALFRARGGNFFQAVFGLFQKLFE